MRPSSTVFLLGFDVNLIMPSSVIVALAEGWFQFITAWILFFEVLAFISIDNAVLTKVIAEVWTNAEKKSDRS